MLLGSRTAVTLLVGTTGAEVAATRRIGGGARPVRTEGDRTNGLAWHLAPRVWPQTRNWECRLNRHSQFHSD